MEAPQSDIDRLLYFEHARRTAESNYSKNPLDADNLMKWGNAFLELSQFQTPAEGRRMMKDGISRLEEAIQVDPRKHEALWRLGNAFTSQAFMTQDSDVARASFQKASDSFRRALDEDPGNELYLKSLEMANKAPDLHLEFQAEIMNQRAGGPSTLHGKKSNKKKNSDLKYDALGWVILAVGIVAWVGMAKSRAPLPPPR